MRDTCNGSSNNTVSPPPDEHHPPVNRAVDGYSRIRRSQARRRFAVGLPLSTRIWFGDERVTVTWHQEHRTSSTGRPAFPARHPRVPLTLSAQCSSSLPDVVSQHHVESTGRTRAKLDPGRHSDQPDEEERPDSLCEALRKRLLRITYTPGFEDRTRRR
jgi:hypothetical protein